MSNKTYSEAVNDQIKTVFRKWSNTPKFFHQLVSRKFSPVGLFLTASGHASRAMAMPQWPVGLDMNLSQPNY